MTTIAELFNLTTTGSPQTPVEKLQKAVDRAEQRLARAQAEADAAVEACGAAHLAEVIDDTPADEKALGRLATAVAVAKSRVEAATSTLATTRANLSAAEATASREAHMARWRTAIAVSARKLDAEKRLAKSAKAFAEDYRAVMALNGEFHQAAPAIPDPEAAMAHATIIETAVRKELLRQGVPWAFSWPYGTVSLPEFLPQCEAAHELVKRWAPEA